jgi:GTPase SAR1 family protein
MTEIFPSEFSTSTKKLKIVLLGDRSVGKSSIIRRFTNNHFQECLSVIFHLISQQSELTL